jgi:tetratricopeptide (TPR) repeat protein
LVGRRLRETREAAGLSQRELSFPGCTAAYISRIEKGERIPSLQLIREFSARLGVSEAFLSHGTHEAVGKDASFVEARVAIRMGEFDGARMLADRLLADARSDAERARASAVYGEIAFHTDTPEIAVEVLERARLLDESLEAADPHFAETLGRAYARALEYETSAAVFMRNRDRAAEAGDAVNEVRFSTLLANAYSDSSNFSAAEQTLSRAINISEDINDPFTRAKMLWAQSRLHALQGDAPTAAKYAERALVILEASDYEFHVGLANQLLAHIELNRGNAERALELLERAVPQVLGSGRVFELASLRIEQARALAQLDRAEDAASVAMQAVGAADTLGEMDAGRCYTLIASVYESLGDDERATELYELAVEKLDAHVSRYTGEAYAKLAALLERRGDKDAAYEVLKRAMSVQQVERDPV